MTAAWIRTLDEGEAAGKLADLYALLADPDTGRVDHVLRAHSLHVEGLEAHWAVYRSAMAGTPSFRKVDRELVAYVVSAENGCHY